MADSPEVIRQQMEETKLQLTDKLVSLEHQVAETVQSTGTAVTATVEAVQAKVETVTGSVQDALHSISKAFDIQHHVNTHPWLVMGGAVVVGYLAADLLEASPRTGQGHNAGAATNSPWQQLKSATIAAVGGIIEDAASQMVPEVKDYLDRNHLLPKSMKTWNPTVPQWQRKSTTIAD